MKCPHCTHSDNHGVYRTFPVGNLICRERVCDTCGRKFYTKEEIYDKLTKDNENQEGLDFGSSEKKGKQ